MGKDQVKVFSHNVFGDLEILRYEGKEYFPATDVAKKLGYSNTSDAITRHCRKDGVVFHDVTDSLGRQQQKKFISEGNLYRLIARSNLPEAEVFEVWVFDEVLPLLRKTGGYVANEDLFIQMYLSEVDSQTKELFKNTLKTLKKQNERLDSMKPKALFADAVNSSESSILVGELAKLIQQNGVSIGQNRLFKWMRENGFLIKRSGGNYNLPTQKSMALGLFEIHKRIIEFDHGPNKVTTTPKVTGKGQVYFISKFLEKK